MRSVPGSVCMTSASSSHPLFTTLGRVSVQHALMRYQMHECLAADSVRHCTVDTVCSHE